MAGLGARLREGLAVGLALLTGLGTVVYSLIDARSVDLTGALGYLSPIMIMSSLTVIAVRRPGMERMRASLRPGVLIGTGQGTAYVLILLAFQQVQGSAGPEGVGWGAGGDGRCGARGLVTVSRNQVSRNYAL